MTRPPGTLLPVLQESDWSGRELSIQRPLFDFDAPRMPLVSYAYDDESRRYTVTPSALEEEGRTREALEAEALAQLSRRRVAWEVRARREDGWPSAMSLVDEYAAARVMLPEGLEEPRARLQSERLWIAMPSRGLLVVHADEGEASARALEAWSRDAFAKAMDTRLTPTVFLVDVDAVRGPLPPPPPPPAPARVTPERYDADERRMLFRFHAGSGGLDLTLLKDAREVERRGRVRPDQPVDEVWVVFETELEAARHAAQVEDVGLVPAHGTHGEVIEWEGSRE